MSPERWSRIKELFHAVVEEVPDRRAPILGKACKDDPALQAEVESLLAAHQSDPEFIERPLTREQADPAGTPTGRQVGPYRLVRTIAAGGMGVVCLAVRADDAYRKQVAVKLLRTDRFLGDTARQADLHRRFQIERQALANLDHPNIARLLDGGTMDDGAPYLVMDFIEGQPIDEYCDTGGLSVRERLELVQTVCTAVQYAHQRLVIHRDLKPSNILVTPEGVPKLLDFGIAKLLDPEFTVAGNPTATALQPMTPEYASPEQVRGERVTTASDVYSLGVVLYELLTGHLPYPLTDKPPHEVARLICEQEPERPSTAVLRVESRLTRDGSRWLSLTPESVSSSREGQPDRLQRRLAGDMDMILLKALRKEPERRYPSIEQFSEDIRRHLVGLPVMARPDTFTYRATKFVQRHRVGVALGLLVMGSLLVGAVGTAWQARVARQERDEAQRAKITEAEQRQNAEANLRRAEQAENNAQVKARTAESVTEFLVDLFKASDPFGETDRAGQVADVTAQELLHQGAQRIAKELKDQPETRAAVQTAMGRVYLSRGLYDRADELLSETLETRVGLLTERHLDTAVSQLDLGSLRRLQGRYREAEVLLRQALDTRQALLGDDHADVAQSLAGLAAVLHKINRFDEAEVLFRRAVAIYRQQPDEHDGLPKILSDFADMLEVQGNYAEAESLFGEALALVRARFGEDHPRVAVTLGRLARLRASRGDFKEAAALHRKVIDILRVHLGNRHPLLAAKLVDLGTALVKNGQYSEAEHHYREALEVYGAASGEESPRVAIALDSLAFTVAKQGRSAEAEPLYREALTMHRRVHGDRHMETARCLTNLAELLNLKHPAEAESMFAEALSINREIFGNEHIQVANALIGLAVAMEAQGRPNAAEPLHREALAIQRKLLSPHHPHLIVSLTNLGRLLTERRELQEAETVLREAAAALHALPDYTHPRRVQVANALVGLALAVEAQGRHDAAEPLHREALAIQRKLFGPHHPHVIISLTNLGRLLTEVGKVEEAEALLREAVGALHALPDYSHPRRAKTFCALALLRHRQGDDEEAIALLEEAITIVRQGLPAEHLDVSEPLVILGKVLVDQGKAAEAEPLLREGWEIRQKALPAGHRYTAVAGSALGRCLTRLDRLDEAEPLLFEPFVTLLIELGPRNRQTEESLEHLLEFVAACQDSKGAPAPAKSEDPGTSRE